MTTIADSHGTTIRKTTGILSGVTVPVLTEKRAWSGIGGFARR